MEAGSPDSRWGRGNLIKVKLLRNSLKIANHGEKLQEYEDSIQYKIYHLGSNGKTCPRIDRSIKGNSKNKMRKS